MKKYIIAAAAALLALAACSKVTPVIAEPEQPITFNVVNYVNSTKAEAANHLEFTGENFGTYAWVTQTNWASEGDATYFWNPANQKITKKDGKWTTTPSYFWPKKAKLSFASYAPYKENGAPTYSKANGWAMASYTIPATTNEDLMFADLVTDLSANVTTPEAQEGDGGYHFAEGVPTLFRHKLTRVNFQFALAEDETAFANIEDVYIVVNAASIVNIKNIGSYAAEAWTPTDATADYTFVTADKELKEKGTFVDADDKDRILLPQLLVADNQQLKISYTIYTKYAGSTAYLEEAIEDETYDLRGTAVSRWTPNMDVLYKVSIYPTEQKPIYFDPAVKDWATQEEQELFANVDAAEPANP